MAKSLSSSALFKANTALAKYKQSLADAEVASDALASSNSGNLAKSLSSSALFKANTALAQYKQSLADAEVASDALSVSESQQTARIKAMVAASMERVKAQNASIAASQQSVQMTDAQRAVMDKLNATTNTQADMNARGAGLLASEERARAKVTASVAD